MNFAMLKEHYLSFQGRLNRKKYFFRQLKLSSFLYITLLPIIMIVKLVSYDDYKDLLFIINLILFLPLASLTIRRFHDLNKSSRWIILLAIPIINIFILLYIFLFKGTEGENKYGPDPLSEENKVTSM